MNIIELDILESDILERVERFKQLLQLYLHILILATYIMLLFIILNK